MLFVDAVTCKQNLYLRVAAEQEQQLLPVQLDQQLLHSAALCCTVLALTMCPAGVLGYVEDTWAKMQSSVLKLQAYTRMFFARKRFQQHRAAALLLQSAWRGRVARLQFAKDLREHKAAVCIQRHYRGGVQRAEYKKVRGWLPTAAACSKAERQQQAMLCCILCVSRAVLN